MRRNHGTGTACWRVHTGGEPLVAFWVAPNTEHYEYVPEFDGVRNPWPRTPYSDVKQYT